MDNKHRINMAHYLSGTYAFTASSDTRGFAPIW